MLAVISPAKTLDFETSVATSQFTTPDFLEDSETLIKKLRGLPESELSALMSISDKLATLNAERYQDWHLPFTEDNARQALLAFKGDVYQGFDLPSWTEKTYSHAQDHLRILSGLYGVLRPLDLMQPYRLEMGTKLKTRRGGSLYDFWGDRITEALNEAIEESGSPVLLNLASNEYFSSVKPKKLKARIVEPVFKDEKNGKFKVISFYAKKARGAMADHVLRRRINQPEALQNFDGLGYAWNEELSTEDKPVFTREEQ